MAKSKLLTPMDDISDVPLIGGFKPVPKITNLKPAGSQLLVETLTLQELANTPISISDKTDLKVPMQGYIRAHGPLARMEEWGLKIGDRVIISGGGVLAPNYDDCERDRYLMEPTAIKCVLIEE